MSLIKLIDFALLGDERGSLVSLEASRNVPFDFKRVYYIFGTGQGVSRGFHAHKQLSQVAVCVKGSCRIVMDDGVVSEDVTLNSPEVGIVIDKMIWHEMHDFTEDCVLLVLADDYYFENDYIRDHKDFINMVSNDTSN